MNRTIFIVGSHNRHIYFLNRLVSQFENFKILMMKREDSIPNSDFINNEIDKINFDRHFKDRKIAEIKHLGNNELSDESLHNTIFVKPDEINDQTTIKLIQNFKPELAIIFGASLILEPLLSILPKNKINLHLGLSPWFRGAATLFWPFYFLKPQFSGSTIHLINKGVDSGQIIHQSTPILEKKDGIHDVAVKTLIKSVDDFYKLNEMIKNNKEIKYFNQKSTGKIWLKSDFQPHHLRVIYNLYNNNIVDEFLNNNLGDKTKKPKLINQF